MAVIPFDSALYAPLFTDPDHAAAVDAFAAAPEDAAPVDERVFAALDVAHASSAAEPIFLVKQFHHNTE